MQGLFIRMTIKILMWNARGWKFKKEELLKFMEDIDIGIITEIKNKIEDKFKIAGFNKSVKNNYNN